MSQEGILLLDLFGETQTGLPTSSPSKKGRSQSLLKSKKSTTEFLSFNSTEEDKLRSTAVDFWSSMTEKEILDMGVLPYRFTYKGEVFRASGTCIRENETIDRYRSELTGKFKTFKREKLLNFLLNVIYKE